MTDAEPVDPLTFIAELMDEHGGELTPNPYGEHAALDQTGSVATPLMAGFALTMATIVITQPNVFRWSDWVLATLTIAVVSLVMSVQAAQSTRAYWVRPDEVLLWWPRMTEWQRQARFRELVKHNKRRAVWSSWQRRSYRLGVLALLAGLTLALVPPEASAHADATSWVRWLAVGIAAAGFVGEVVWLFLNIVLGLPPPPTTSAPPSRSHDSDR